MKNRDKELDWLWAVAAALVAPSAFFYLLSLILR